MSFCPHCEGQRFDRARVLRALRAERAVLSADVIRVVSEIKPSELEALFPPEHPDRIFESSEARARSGSAGPRSNAQRCGESIEG